MSHNFPDTVAWLDVAAATLGAKVARATLVALQPQGRVYRHVDGGEYYKVRDRYHLVIWSPGGSRMVWDEETVTFHEGELWWFDNKAPHQAFNDTDDARTHLIFDVTPPLYAHLDEVP